MTDPSDDTRENGSPRHQEDESSEPRQTRPTDQAPFAPPQALPAASSSVQSTPPMQPTAAVTESMTSSWPIMLGTLAIVFGGLGVLGGVWGVVNLLFVDLLADVFLQTQVQVALDVDLWFGWNVMVLIGSLLASSLLLFAGILLLLRRHRAVSIVFIWSILKIVVVLGNMGLQFAMQPQVMDQMAAQAQAVPGGRSTMYGGLIIVFGCSAILQFAGPVFSLVWFRRSVIKEELATWR